MLLFCGAISNDELLQTIRVLRGSDPENGDPVQTIPININVYSL